MIVKSLAHVCVNTTDLEKTTAFYCDALGMEKLFAFTRKGMVIGYYLKACNQTYIEVFKVDAIEKSGNQALNHFCLETDHIQEARAALDTLGYRPGEIKMGCDKSLQFWVEDPNGIKLEFHQYTGESSQVTGMDVEVDW